MIEVDTKELIDIPVPVPVLLLPYGTVFTYEHGIGIRIDDGWITISDGWITAFIDAEYEENNTTRSLFASVRPVPNFMLKLILKKIND